LIAKVKVLLAMLLALSATARAVSSGTALFDAPGQRSLARSTRDVTLPHAIRFREVPGRGLMLRTWVNGVGPFNFALDTGAGAILLSPRVANEARVPTDNRETTTIVGLSGARTTARHASVSSLAAGDSENFLPARGEVMVASGLPAELDGLLDPTEAFSPFGYVIDIPQGELSAFDPQIDPVRSSQQPPDGAVVPWVRETHGRRPFVMLNNGDRALLDTGSSLGLAIRETAPGDRRRPPYEVRDVGGGQMSARRVTTSNVAIGSLTLQRIPTDLLSGSQADAPVLLGLRALRPFRMKFDLVHHLIEIFPVNNLRR
jgi:predicted aspartyl protease